MRNFNALTLGRKQDRVVTKHVSGANGFKTNLLVRTLAGDAFSAVYSHIIEPLAHGITSTTGQLLSPGGVFL